MIMRGRCLYSDKVGKAEAELGRVRGVTPDDRPTSWTPTPPERLLRATHLGGYW